MTASAPPRPPVPEALQEWPAPAPVPQPNEALIEEARERARRRRRRYLRALLLTALLGSAAYLALAHEVGRRSPVEGDGSRPLSSRAGPQTTGRIVFVRNRPRTMRRVYGSELWSMNADGSGLRRLTPESRIFEDDDDPALSPDGRLIAFTERPHGAGAGISVMTTAGKNIVRLTTHPDSGSVFDPAWSPDGRKIAFATNRYSGDGYTNDIYVINTDGSGLTRLVRHSVGIGLGKYGELSNGGPAWSPDGQKVAFVNGNLDLCVVDADGRHQRVLVRSLSEPNAPRLISGPAWSPDGTWIAFQHGGEGWEPSEVELVRADGSGWRNLTRNPAEDGAPTWSPDGSSIAFTSERDHGIPNVYSMRIDNGSLRRLTHSSLGEWEPSWAPDAEQ